MVIGRIRRWFMLFVLGVFVVVGLGHSMPIVQTAPMSAETTMPDMMLGMSAHMHALHMQVADHQAPMPCKSPMPNCDSSLGCIFMVALPPVLAPSFAPMAWSAVSYVQVAAVPLGLAFQPDLGPPILV